MKKAVFAGGVGFTLSLRKLAQLVEQFEASAGVAEVLHVKVHAIDERQVGVGDRRTERPGRYGA